MSPTEQICVGAPSYKHDIQLYMKTNYKKFNIMKIELCEMSTVHIQRKIKQC